MTNKQWSASNYRANKAKRFESVTPEWVTNPETGAEFLLRRTGAMSAMIANYMPNVAHMADGVVAKWKEAGVEISGSPELHDGYLYNGETAKRLALVTPEKIAEGERDLKLMARIVQAACVIPKLVVGATAEDELDPSELDDSDVLFIFKYATGQYGSLKGAEIATVDDLAQFRKQPAIMSRTSDVVTEHGDEVKYTAATG